MSEEEKRTSIKTLSREKEEMLRYASYFLLTELKEKMDLHDVKRFTDGNIKKLLESLQNDFVLNIPEKENRTPKKLKLLISAIVDIIKALKSIRRGRSGDGPDGSLTQLDRQIKDIFLVDGDDDKVPSQGEDTTRVGGENLGGAADARVKFSNIFTQLFPGDNIRRVPQSIPLEANPIFTIGNQPLVRPVPGPSGQARVGNPSLVGPVPGPSGQARVGNPSLVGSVPGPSGVRKRTITDALPCIRPDHASRKKKNADSLLKRRTCHPRGLRETSQMMLQEALDMNPVIGEVAAEARKLIHEDGWDKFGKSIAQKMALLHEDEKEQIGAASDILGKIYRDARGQ